MNSVPVNSYQTLNANPVLPSDERLKAFIEDLGGTCSTGQLKMFRRRMYELRAENTGQNN